MYLVCLVFVISLLKMYVTAADLLQIVAVCCTFCVSYLFTRDFHLIFCFSLPFTTAAACSHRSQLMFFVLRPCCLFDRRLHFATTAALRHLICKALVARLDASSSCLARHVHLLVVVLHFSDCLPFFHVFYLCLLCKRVLAFRARVVRVSVGCAKLIARIRHGGRGQPARNACKSF